VHSVGQFSSLLVASLKKFVLWDFCIVVAGALHPLCRLLQKFLRGGAAMAASRKIHRCFERVNQLLSLLVPVSDINRAAAGRVAVVTISQARKGLMKLLAIRLGCHKDDSQVAGYRELPTFGALRRRLCQTILGGQYFWRRNKITSQTYPIPKRANGEV
jgi:hypothetical protein